MVGSFSTLVCYFSGGNVRILCLALRRLDWEDKLFDMFCLLVFASPSN